VHVNAQECKELRCFVGVLQNVLQNSFGRSFVNKSIVRYAEPLRQVNAINIQLNFSLKRVIIKCWAASLFSTASCTVLGRFGSQKPDRPRHRGRSSHERAVLMSDLHSRFLSFLHRIESHAKFFFRDTRCSAKLADYVAEVVALAWKWYAELEQRGKDAWKFVSAIASYAVKAVKCGRRVAKMERAKDALNPRAQRRSGFSVERLPDINPASDNPFTEALADNTQTPPPDAAAFRVDFPVWLRTLTLRDRRLAEKLMIGERPHETAERFGLSRARVSQLRRELSLDWSRFHGDDDVSVAA